MIRDNIQISGKTNAIIKSMHLSEATNVEFSLDYSVEPCRMTVKVFYNDSGRTFNLRIPSNSTSLVKFLIKREVRNGNSSRISSSST